MSEFQPRTFKEALLASILKANNSNSGAVLADADSCFDTATYLIDETSLNVPVARGVLQVFGNSEYSCQIVTPVPLAKWTVNAYHVAGVAAVNEAISEEEALMFAAKYAYKWNSSTMVWEKAKISKAVPGIAGESSIQIVGRFPTSPVSGDILYIGAPLGTYVRSFNGTTWSEWFYVNQ